MQYLTPQLTQDVIGRLKTFENELCDVFQKYGYDLRDNLGRRNQLVSQAQEKEFAKYNTDSSAAPAANFGIFWVTAFFFVGLYILFTGPEGTWPFFIINVIVFAMATVYNFCFHFKIAFLFGRDKVNSTIEQPIVSAVVLVLNLIIIYGLSDKIYL